MSGLLLDPPGQILQRVLINGGLGGDIDLTPAVLWPVYYHNQPDQPDNCITVYDSDGQYDGRDHNSGESQEHYGLQINVRSRGVFVGDDKIRAIKQYCETQILRTTVTVGVNDYHFQSITSVGTIISVGYDTPQTKRDIFTWNILADLRQLQP